MALLDYLLVYPDRAAAQADLTTYSAYGLRLWAEDEGGQAVLCGAYAFEPRVYVLTGTILTQTDPLTGLVTETPERSYLAHHYLWLTLPERDAALEARPSFGLVADREAFEAGDANFVRATNFTPEQLAASWVEPVMAGTRYPFGGLGTPGT